MPEPTVPTTCTNSPCDGVGYLPDGSICPVCFTGGSLPLRGVNIFVLKYAYENSLKLAILEDKVDGLDAKMDTLDTHLDVIETKIEELE